MNDEFFLRIESFSQSDTADGVRHDVQPMKITRTKFLHVQVHGNIPTGRLPLMGRLTRHDIQKEFYLGISTTIGSNTYRLTIDREILTEGSRYIIRIADNFDSPTCLVSHTIATLRSDSSSGSTPPASDTECIPYTSSATQALTRPQGGLQPGHSVPNSSEADAVGRAFTKIRRGTAEFRNLAKSMNVDILFQADDVDDRNRIMTRLLKEKTDILAAYVKADWPDLRLLVKEAWDGDNRHGDHSLHYEGRAVDISISDADSTRLPRLFELAVEAEFGWVQFNEDHIHASMRR